MESVRMLQLSMVSSSSSTTTGSKPFAPTAVAADDRARLARECSSSSCRLRLLLRDGAASSANKSISLSCSCSRLCSLSSTTSSGCSASSSIFWTLLFFLTSCTTSDNSSRSSSPVVSLSPPSCFFFSTRIGRALAVSSSSSSSVLSSSSSSSSSAVLLTTEHNRQARPNGSHEDMDRAVEDEFTASAMAAVATSAAKVASFEDDGELMVQCYRFGQLIGIALRSKSVLDVDIADYFWKQLVGEPVSVADLASIDYTTYKTLQFCDPRDNHPFDEQEFYAYYGRLAYVCALSDGSTTVELFPGGAKHVVRFADRWRFADTMVRVRLAETNVQVEAVRRGLLTIVPADALQLLTWRELQTRVCGNAVVDLALLKRHTSYSPRRYDENSDVVRNFWRVLESLDERDTGKFLQFAWARSRLPPADEAEATWRLKLNIIDSLSEEDLPTAETCFFNVNMPHYKSYDKMRRKIMLAIMHCSSITS
eukprot:TRINITY_DN67520_c8_g3_i2.p1 TRINITY_DN67520_c8_g3~~TRINITY_DN67520_c8_g3_i2.p1  ORF type:complete len:480 (+),score=192.22 TRINITY_DN67520_c8_g3_i2:1281-2720(+)